MTVDQSGGDRSWPVPAVETPAERRRRQRREYHARRSRAIAGGPDHGQRWTVSDARTALDTTLSVPEAALKVGRSATAVESLRRRWRTGRLPASLAAHMPEPPRPSSPPTTEPDK